MITGLVVEAHWINKNEISPNVLHNKAFKVLGDAPEDTVDC